MEGIENLTDLFSTSSECACCRRKIVLELFPVLARKVEQLNKRGLQPLTSCRGNIHQTEPLVRGPRVESFGPDL